MALMEAEAPNLVITSDLRCLLPLFPATPATFDSDVDESQLRGDHLEPLFRITSATHLRALTIDDIKQEIQLLVKDMYMVDVARSEFVMLLCTFRCPANPDYWFRLEKMNFCDSLEQVIQRWELPRGEAQACVRIRMDPCRKCHLWHTDCLWRPPLETGSAAACCPHGT